MKANRDRQLLTDVAVILSVSVLASNCATFLHPRLTTRIKTYYCERVETVGGSGLPETLSALEAEGEAARQVLLRLAATSDEYRMCACGWLELMKDPRVVPIVRRFLDDPSTPGWQVSHFVGTVAVFSDEASYDRVLELLRTGDQATQDMAIEYLGSVHTDQARAELRRLAVTPKWWGNVRIAGAIGRQRDPEAVGILVDYATRSHPDTYPYLAIAMARIRTPSALKASESTLSKITEPDRRSRTILEIIDALNLQRDQATDPAERASIDEAIAQFRKVSKLIES